MRVMLRCLLLRHDLQAFLDGEATPERAARLAAHLAECHRCGIESETITQVIATIRSRKNTVDRDVHERLVAAVDTLTDDSDPL